MSAILRVVYDLLKFTIIALLIITPFRFFVAQPFIVSGASMEPTLEKGEYLVIDELTYRFEEPQRGDVIIFRYPLDPAVFFVKRVIGLPGEAVEIRDGVVSIRDAENEKVVLEEPYLVPEHVTKDTSTIRLAGDEYFVMGDNRNASADSRVWGPLKKEYIIGRAYLRLFPVHEAGVLPGKHSFSENE